MRAIFEDGTTVECGGFKAIDTGVVLTEDEDRDDVIGFVPNDELRYILPDETVDLELPEGAAEGWGDADEQPGREQGIRTTWSWMWPQVPEETR